MKKRRKPSDVAKLNGNLSWFEHIDKDTRKWIFEITSEMAKLPTPAYYSVASYIILELGINITENAVVKVLKREVKQCREKNQAK